MSMKSENFTQNNNNNILILGLGKKDVARIPNVQILRQEIFFRLRRSGNGLSS